MSFSFVVSGNATRAIEPNDEEEGEAVKSLMQEILDEAQALYLNVVIQTPNPAHWSLETMQTPPEAKASLPKSDTRPASPESKS